MTQVRFHDYPASPKEYGLRSCAGCGSTSGRFFAITVNNQTRAFDSFECAIHVMAPTCSRCGCRILGHPVEAYPNFYCCAHCAGEAGGRGAAGRP